MRISNSKVVDLNKVIDNSKQTLGLSDEQFLKILGDCEISPGFDAFRLPCCKLAMLWKALSIPFEAIYIGYDQEEHLKCISNSSLSQEQQTEVESITESKNQNLESNRKKELATFNVSTTNL